MNLVKRVWDSSVGKKYLMAVTGGGLVLFVIGHLIGNLQIFLPPEAINRYAHLLKSNPALLWAVRLGLLGLAGVHVISAIRLSLENRAARPVAYLGAPVPYAASYASRTMLMSGLILASFVIYHLLHFTALVPGVNFTGADFATLRDPVTGHADVHRMLVLGFSKWYVSLFYIVAVGLLCLHLSHGVNALFQSIGWRKKSVGVVMNWAARLGAVLLFAGYASIPIAILCGYGQERLQRRDVPPQPAAVEKANAK